MRQKNRVFSLGLLFECGLGFLGFAIAWLAGISLTGQLQPSLAAIELGLLATLPMFAMLGLISVTNWAPIVALRRQVEEIVQQLFGDANWLDVAVMSVAAGVGEEILFRGALQLWIASWTNPWTALSVVSLLFGLAHSLSTTYFVVATAIGAYFGWLALEYDDLIAPIVAHAVYDFVAILYFRSRAAAQ
ncbi:MAG: CPBP family intramembrane glutamic endopeptidase [Planctomycetota bacterium]